MLAKTATSGGFPKLGVPLWGSLNKDYTILGSTLGFPNFGKLPSILAVLRMMVCIVMVL